MFERPSNVDSVDVIQVIRVASLKGNGVEGSPIRQIVEYWSMDGKVLATTDEWEESNRAARKGEGG